MRAALVAVLWHCAAARIRRVEVRALGTTPRLGGPLATPAAQKVLGAGPKRATNDKTRKALAEDDPEGVLFGWKPGSPAGWPKWLPPKKPKK